MSGGLPEVVRIKRKRNQDSLQALILEAPKNKRIKDHLYIFKLQRTDDTIVQLSNEGDKTLPLLQESSGLNDKSNTYILPKEQKEEVEKLPEELTEMLDSILINSGETNELIHYDDNKPLKKRKHKTIISDNQNTSKNINTEPVDLGYVYDVYYRDKAVHESWEKDRIGYIKFEENSGLTVDEDDNSINELSDDEDSNAEDFYQNDYPEDEDAHSTQDEGDDDVESQTSLEKLTESLHKDDFNEFEDEAFDSKEFDDIYEKFYEEQDDDIDFLKSLNKDLENEDQHYEDSDIEDYPRQNFFPDEQDDELAKHRDKIFGKLQKLINED